MLDALIPLGPGEGPLWERLAEWLRSQMPVADVDGIWVLRVVRKEQREYGTAILSSVDTERRRIYTATYVAVIKGKTRGGFEATLTEVGSGPVEALHELLAMVPVRSDDEDPPTPVTAATWFPPIAAITEITDEAAAEIPANEESVVSTSEGDGHA